MGRILSILHLTGGRQGQREAFRRRVVRAGRSPACDLKFDARRDLDASALHAEIRRARDGFRLLDLGSTNGTLVNGEPAVERVLGDGDEIEFGRGGPRVRVSIRTAGPGGWLRAVLAGLLVLVGGAVLVAWALGRGGGDGPSEDGPTTTAGGPAVRAPAPEILVAVCGRAWLETADGPDVIAERWGTGVVLDGEGTVVVPKHVVRPWRFHAEAAARVQHHGEAVRFEVGAWPPGAALRRAGEPDWDAAWTAGAGTLVVTEADDVLEAVVRRVTLRSGGVEGREDVRLHAPGEADIARLRLVGFDGPARHLEAAEALPLPRRVEEVRVLGQFGTPSLVGRLAPESAARRVLKRLDGGFEVEAGPRIWSGAVAFWGDRPVGLYSELTGRYTSMPDALRAAGLEGIASEKERP